MEQLNKPLHREYSPVKLFEEDLESIEDLLSSAKNLKIKSKEHEFSKTKELKSKYKNKTINELEISTDEPYIRIEFKKLWAKLYVGSDKDVEAGLFYKIDRVIKSALRQPPFLYSYLTILIGIFVLSTVRHILQGVAYQVCSFIYYLFLIWAIWVFYIRWSAHSQIIISKRKGLQSYLESNKYKIIEKLFFVVLGMTLTIILQKLGVLK